MINFRYTCVTLNLRQIAGDWGEKDDFNKGLEGGQLQRFPFLCRSCHSQSLLFPLMGTVLGSTHPTGFL